MANTDLHYQSWVEKEALWSILFGLPLPHQLLAIYKNLHEYAQGIKNPQDDSSYT